MNQTTLHKYFQGIASETEQKFILQWIEESEENKVRFRKERFLYDVALFHTEKEVETPLKGRRTISILKWPLRIAASIIVIACCGVLISEYINSGDIQYQTVSAPLGHRAQIVLADGTRVWLNAETTLKYPTTFGKKSRTVELDGEAYFEVTKNPEKPFYVLTERNKIEVIGTSFNVNAYKDTKVFEITLIEGIVDIYALESAKPITRLAPHEVYLSDQEGQKKKKINPQEKVTWKDGIYTFDDTSFKVILEKLEKFYKVKFIVKDEKVLDYHITGKFRDKDGVEHILKTIQKDHHFSYVMTANDTIFIKK